MSNTSKSITEKNREKTRTLTVTGIMCGIVIVMSFPFVGTIVLPAVSATIAFLPVIITTIMLGLKPGLVVAFVGGIASLVRALFVVNALSPFFLNPLVSILPRLMIAVMVWLAFKGLMSLPLPKTFDKIPLAVAISAAVGSVTNTILVLGSIYLWHVAPLRNGGPILANFGPPIANQMSEFGILGEPATWLFGIGAANGGIELIVNALLATILVLTLRNAKFAKF
ncbi:MAG: ECF transporter S component [Defluviitaleaceae bacterium]|nr:ECF transporter S component [Defluviitaleaceae bacterium]